jgi:hypothetical protein
VSGWATCRFLARFARISGEKSWEGVILDSLLKSKRWQSKILAIVKKVKAGPVKFWQDFNK